MTTAATAIDTLAVTPPDHILRRILSDRRMIIGGSFLLLVVGVCVGTLPWTMHDTTRFYYDYQNDLLPEQPPAWIVHEDPLDDKSPLIDSRAFIFGTDKLGRSIFARCLMGGSISLGGRCCPFNDSRTFGILQAGSSANGERQIRALIPLRKS